VPKTVDSQVGPQTAEGGNLAFKDPKAPVLYQPAKFMDKSGQPDNQSVDRPKGST
jgi:hypothetical protein